jgi:hypothetical protein
MEPVAGSIELLWHLERSTAQLPARQVSTCRKAALLAIGNFCLEYIQQPDKVDVAWQIVASETWHRMTGRQLQGLYLAMKAQQTEVELARVLQLGEQEAQQLQRLEDEEDATCVAAALAVQQSQSTTVEDTGTALSVSWPLPASFLGHPACAPSMARCSCQVSDA